MKKIINYCIGILFSLAIALAFMPETAEAAVVSNLPAVVDFDKDKVSVPWTSPADLKNIQRTKYVIARDALKAPSPLEGHSGIFGFDGAADLQTIVDRARTMGILGANEAVIFNPAAEFYGSANRTFEAYLDETILVLCWKEAINGKYISFCEVKVADASQFRRKLTGDAYGTGIKQPASELYRQTNAVVATTADFYANRGKGIVAYNGQIFRHEPSLDTLFIDNNGNFKILHRNEIVSPEATQEYMNMNGLNFSLTFGPALIENGQRVPLPARYSGGLGEPYDPYSRAAIAQVGPLHYLYAVANFGVHNGVSTGACTLDQFADILATKKLQTAYNLDGGQTGEIYFNNKIFNGIDFSKERPVSDIIYFATAIPENMR